MNKFQMLCASALIGMMAATPAHAVTYDAFASFTGATPQSGTTNGSFIYGEADSTTPATAGIFFTANTNCFIAGSTCLQAAPNTDVPGVTKSTVPSFQYGTVNVPTDRLLLHPGRNSNQTFLAFVAPTAGVYTINAFFNIQDINPTGVGINQITTTAGGLPLVFLPLGSINGSSPTFSFSTTVTLIASEAFGFGIDNAGNVNNDSIGVNFSATAVPEPGTWGMMIAGFGVAGAALRRRKTPSRRAAQAC